MTLQQYRFHRRLTRAQLAQLRLFLSEPGAYRRGGSHGLNCRRALVEDFVWARRALKGVRS
jgi:hypothetical protein